MQLHSTSNALLMLIFNALDFLKLNYFNNPGVCKNILFSIFMEDFSIKTANKMKRINCAAVVSGLSCD